MDFNHFRNSLKQAVTINDVESVREILSNISELSSNSGWELGELLTAEAAKCDNDEIIEALFNFVDLEPNHKNLMIAVFKGDVKLVESLLKKSAKFESYQYTRNLCTSILRRTKIRKEMLTLLIKYRFNVTAQSKYGLSILSLFINRFARKEDQDVLEIVEILIKSGVSVHGVNDHGCPLHSAVYREDIELVSFLIKNGADVNKVNDGGGLPVYLAVGYNNIDIVDLLLSNGADVNSKTEFGSTALHKACTFSNLPIARLLISYGADVNAEDSDGWTPLHRACYNHHEDIINTLLNQGADIGAEDDIFETPIFKLGSSGKNYDRCLLVMVKEFSKLSFENKSISKTNVNYIQSNPKAREYFEKLKSELELMASTKFYASYSFYSLLKMSMGMKKLSGLTKNEKLVLHFESNVVKFHHFDEDLERIWDEAIQTKKKSEAVESRLKSALGDTFPDLVLKKLAKNLSIEELSLE